VCVCISQCCGMTCPTPFLFKKKIKTGETEKVGPVRKFNLNLIFS
jgi:hypothetical protein